MKDRPYWVAVAALSFLVYANKFGNEFVWDDNLFIVGDLASRGLGLSNIIAYFTEPVAALYRPGRSLLYATAYAVGAQAPFVYHLFGVTFHALASVAAYFIARSCLKSARWAFAVAAIFAVHPLKSGRVTNMTGSFDLPAIVFYLWALAILTHYIVTADKKPWRLVLSGALFVCGLFCGEEAFTFPAAAALAMFFFKNKSKPTKALWGFVGATFVLLGAFLVLRTTVITHISRGDALVHPALGVVATSFLGFFARYLQLFFFPMGQSNLYDDLTPLFTMANPWSLTGLALALIGTAAVLCFWKKGKVVAFGLCMGALTLTPFMNIVPIPTLFAERYFYLPSFGFILAFVALAKTAPVGKPAFRVALVMLLVVLGVLTLSRNRVWQNEQILYEDAYKKRPASPSARHNLATIYYQKGATALKNGAPDEAEKWFSRSVSINDLGNSHLGLAIIATQRNDEKTEMLELNKVLAKDPTNGNARMILAQRLYKNGQVEAAGVMILPATRDWRNTDKSWALLGLICQELALDDPSCIAGVWEKPDPRLWLGRARACEKAKDNDCAIKQYTRFLKAVPDTPLSAQARQAIDSLGGTQ